MSNYTIICFVASRGTKDLKPKVAFSVVSLSEKSHNLKASWLLDASFDVDDSLQSEKYLPDTPASDGCTAT